MIVELSNELLVSVQDKILLCRSSPFLANRDVRLVIILHGVRIEGATTATRRISSCETDVVFLLEI